MGKFFFLGRLFVAVIFLFLFFLVVQYAGFIRTRIAGQFFRSTKAVASAHTNFETEVKRNVSEYAEQGREKIMEIKLSDVIQVLSRTTKIVHDVSVLKDSIVRQVNSHLKK